MEVFGKYLALVAAIAAGTAIVIYGDPDKAERWGTLATAAITAFVAYQQRQQGQVLQEQNRSREVLSNKVEAIARDVNGVTTAAVSVSEKAGYAQGAKETLDALQPAIVAAVASERAAGVVAGREG